MLKKTFLLDSAANIYTQLNSGSAVPEELTLQRKEVQTQIQRLESLVKPFEPLFQDMNKVNELIKGNMLNVSYLSDEYHVEASNVEALFDFAKCQFECGNYSKASGLLFLYSQLGQQSDLLLGCLWGKCAADILQGDWEVARRTLLALKERLDAVSFVNPVELLQNRTAFLHVALFVCFNSEGGLSLWVDLGAVEPYISAISLNAPHLFRYLAFAMVINRKRKSILRDFAQLLARDGGDYSDPLTRFLVSLQVDFNFDAAQAVLKECEVLLNQDYFLHAHKAEFMENARLFIFETYCRIHKRVDINYLAEKVDMDVVSAEKWVVNLIRNRLDAKIDSENNTVVMGVHHPSVYHRVIERTKNLSFRSQVLASNLNSRTLMPKLRRESGQTNRRAVETE